MSEQKSFLDKILPDTHLSAVTGVVEESGTSVVEGSGNNRPQRWIKVQGRVLTGLDDGLYHSQYGNEVDIVFDRSNKVVGYWNETIQAGSEPSKSGVIGAIALALIFTAIGYYGGIWNFIWKKIAIHYWWTAVLVLGIFGLYALVWTPMFAFRETKRETLAHQMLADMRRKG